MAMPALHRASMAILAHADRKVKGKNVDCYDDDHDDDISEISFDDRSIDYDNDNRNNATNANDMAVKSSSSVVSSDTVSTRRSNSIYKRVRKKDIVDSNNNKNKDTLSASIHVACYKGDLKAVKAYLSTDGDKINEPIKFLPYQLISQYERRDPRYKPPPSLPILVKDAIDTAIDNGVMQLSLDQRWILSRMFSNSTLLHYACLSNQVDIVKLLLENGADKLILNDDKNTTTT
jgi:hypothetical protein